MKFEYHVFKVEPFLEAKVQPSYVFKNIQPTMVYHTLTNPDSGFFSTTTNNSEGVRVPVFAHVTQKVQVPDADTLQLEYGSLLVAMGMEVAFKFISQLKMRHPIERIMTVIATNCHELNDNRYRAYFGLTLETRK